MFSPNTRPPRLPKDSGEGAKKKKLTSENKRQLAAMLIMTVALFFLYFGSMALAELYPHRFGYLVTLVMTVFMVAFAVLLLIYLIYNRAFVNRHVTVDMLPLDWSEEKKQAFVEGNRARAERSRWMLVLIIPFLVVFMAEALYLFVWNGWLGALVS